MFAPWAVLPGLLSILSQQSRPATPPAQALAALLDLPSAAARRAAADQLAARTDVSLAQWLTAASAVPLRPDTPERIDERTWRHRVALWVTEAERRADRRTCAAKCAPLDRLVAHVRPRPSRCSGLPVQDPDAGA